MHAILPAAPTEIVTVEIPSLRVLKVAMLVSDKLGKVAVPISDRTETRPAVVQTAESVARTVRPARRRAVA